MLLARAFSDSGGRIEEDSLTKLTHLAKNYFEPTVVGNGLLIELCLLFGQSHRDRPGFDLSSQAPCIGWLAHQAALGDPTQFN